jgi:hypothetical protein
LPTAYAWAGAVPAAGEYGVVMLCGASDEAVVEARIGAADADAVVAPEIPISVSDVQAARPPVPAAAAANPKISVRLRIVTIVGEVAVHTLRTARGLRHTTLCPASF